MIILINNQNRGGQLQIPFHRTFFNGDDFNKIFNSLDLQHLHGNGPVSKKVKNFLLKEFNFTNTFLTPSCTSSLEMASLIANIKVGDEVILPSYTYVTSASAFVQRGAQLVFVDVEPETLCINSKIFSDSITAKTKAIVPVHYGGWCADIDKICQIAKENNIFVIEDAAQALGSVYKNKNLGTYGDFAAISCHSTKNIGCGEGGLLITSSDFVSKAEIIQDKGTNRKAFERQETDFYTWIELGSSFLMSELNACWYYSQLPHHEKVNTQRGQIWQHYNRTLSSTLKKYEIATPQPSDQCVHNSHLYYLIFPELEKKKSFISYMRERDIDVRTHYVPLHLSPMGKKFGRINSQLKVTENIAHGLVRLPLYPEMIAKKEIVTDSILEYLSVF